MDRQGRTWMTIFSLVLMLENISGAERRCSEDRINYFTKIADSVMETSPHILREVEHMKTSKLSEYFTDCQCIPDGHKYCQLIMSTFYRGVTDSAATQKSGKMEETVPYNSAVFYQAERNLFYQPNIARISFSIFLTT